MNSQIPKITQQDGITSMDVAANLGGMGARFITRIVEEFRKYKRDTFLLDASGKEYACKTTNLFEFMVGVAAGPNLKIKVVGEDMGAKLCAVRMYAALTSQDLDSLDFCRFDGEVLFHDAKRETLSLSDRVSMTLFPDVCAGNLDYADLDFVTDYLKSRHIKTKDGQDKPEKEVLDELLGLRRLVAKTDKQSVSFDKLRIVLKDCMAESVKEIVDLASLYGSPVYERLKQVHKAGKAKDLDEMIACASVELQDFTVLARLGNGALKTAYLAKNKNLDHDVVLLKIEPASKGYLHYKNVYKQIKDEDIRKKVYETEFSAYKLSQLEDSKFIALMQLPTTGEIGGKSFFFIPTFKKYEKTLEDVLKEAEEKKQNISSSKALKYFYQICYALNNCHKYKEPIIHKDLKPDNIGVDANNDILLSDFGCTSMFSEDADCRYQCPLELRPPELAYDEEHWKEQGIEWQSDLFTPEANVWSAGVILYRMLTGNRLFKITGDRAPIGSKEWKNQNKEVYKQIQCFDQKQGSGKSKRDEVMAEISSISADYAKMLDLCLIMNPEKRKDALEKCIKICEGIQKTEENSFKIKSLIALTPADWEILADCFRPQSRVSAYAKQVAQRNLPADSQLDLEHRQYIFQRDWIYIQKAMDRIGLRKLFCYARQEECVSLTLDDFRNGKEHLEDIETKYSDGNFVLLKWDKDQWRCYKSVLEKAMLYELGNINFVPPEFKNEILKRWLLSPEDVADLAKTSPAALSAISRKKAEQKPAEAKKALDYTLKQIRESHDWNLEISINLFKEAGLENEKDIAKALQEEYFFHFGIRPAICTYYMFYPPENTEQDEVVKRFVRFPDLSKLNAFMDSNSYKNKKIILPGVF